MRRRGLWLLSVGGGGSGCCSTVGSLNDMLSEEQKEMKIHEFFLLPRAWAQSLLETQSW